MKLQAMIEGKREGQRIDIPMTVDAVNIVFNVPSGKPRQNHCEFSVTKVELLAAIEALDPPGEAEKPSEGQPRPVD